MLNFKELRKHYGYTLESVAMATGLSIGTIHYAENGIDMKISTYNKLSDFYKSQENNAENLRYIQIEPEHFNWIRKYFFGFTLQYVADGTGLSPRTISNAEKGKCDKLSSIRKIQAYYMQQYQYRKNYPQRWPLVKEYALC